MGKGILSYIIYISIFLCIYVIFQEGHDPNKNMAFPKRRGKTSVETSGLNHRWYNFPWPLWAAGEGHQRSFYGQGVSVMVARVYFKDFWCIFNSKLWNYQRLLWSIIYNGATVVHIYIYIWAGTPTPPPPARWFPPPLWQGRGGFLSSQAMVYVVFIVHIMHMYR